jgi:hypothetical protein
MRTGPHRPGTYLPLKGKTEELSRASVAAVSACDSQRIPALLVLVVNFIPPQLACVKDYFQASPGLLRILTQSDTQLQLHLP